MFISLSNIIALTAFLLAILLLPALAPAQKVEEEPRDLLRNALQLRNTPADSGYAFYRAMTIITCRSAGDTTTADAESIEAADLDIIRSDSTEVWQDSKSMVVIDHRSKTVRYIDLRSRGEIVAGQRRLQSAFPDSLAEHAQEIEFQGQHSVDPGLQPAHTLSFRVVPEMQRFYNAERITLDIRSDGEITRFAIGHPKGGGLLSTEYNVTEINRRYSEIDLTKPVKEQFFTAEGTLHGAYKGYNLISSIHRE